MGCPGAAGCNLKQLCPPGQPNPSSLLTRRVSTDICRKGGQQFSMNTKEGLKSLTEQARTKISGLNKNQCSLTWSFAASVAALAVQRFGQGDKSTRRDPRNLKAVAADSWACIALVQSNPQRFAKNSPPGRAGKPLQHQNPLGRLWDSRAQDPCEETGLTRTNLPAPRGEREAPCTNNCL